ncbi:maturation protein [ssRNA phage Zoerhiza.2_27]|uniref:Maturation protein n=2 Tax=Leviviricetes TaxID=2842243 RepID=A0A8S5KX87_9VIRU|nr:maturation protein [ssRNA phage Zoerhiza.2_27]QDH90440.1 MAG: hypothetical protein H2Rhizo33695_000001 [Leviviridae sp.]DAD49966.1 TPA_asm: maturation protein [ssRNA phage Zoerhiza.2_27]
MARYRERVTTSPGGTATDPSGLLPDEHQGVTTMLTQWMVDVDNNPGHPNPLTAVRYQDIVGAYSGPSGYYTTHRWLFNCDISPYFGPARVELPSANLVLSAGLAATNPSKPQIDLPVFVYELKDLPGMIHSSWGKLLKITPHPEKISIASASKRGGRIGNSAVEYNFGWAPLINDLKGLVNIMPNIDKRFNELKGLKDTGVLAKSGPSFRNDFTFYRDRYCVNLYGAYAQCHVHMHAFEKTWSSIHWVADNQKALQSTPDADLHDIAQRAILGQNASLASVWEALPWSWLADYFSNVGDLVNGQRNSVGAHPDGMCVMTSIGCDVVGLEQFAGPAGGSLAGLGGKVISKYRGGYSLVYPEARLPFLNASQLTTLSSIAVNIGQNSRALG